MEDPVHDNAIEWSRELSAVDYLMYRADADSRSRTTIMYIETLDVAPDWHRLRADIDRASRVALRLRQRVVAPLLPLVPARWVVDPDFDLDYHLRRISLPAPGDFRHLLDTAAVMYAAPLDLGRPLWEVTLVEGLDDGDAHAALIWKVSHSVTDGVGGTVLERMIRTSDRDPQRDPMPALPVPEDVSPVDLTRGATRRLPTSLLVGSARRLAGAVGGVGRAARDPSAAVRRTAQIADTMRRLARPAVEPSPLLRRRSLNRRFEALDVPLSGLRDAAKDHGCSVNDAYIAALTGALRHYHEQLGVPIEAIALAIPINLRSAGDAVGVDNQWGGATLAAPVGERDPVRRMRAIRELVLTARTGSNLNVLALLAPVLGWLPHQLLAGLGAGSIGVDVQASNVPGHPSPRYVGGAKVLRVVPIGPVPGVAIMVTMVSVAGRCFVGVNFDSVAVTDHELFATSLRLGFDEVIAVGSDTGGEATATRKTTAATRRSPPKKPAPTKRPPATTAK